MLTGVCHKKNERSIKYHKLKGLPSATNSKGTPMSTSRWAKTSKTSSRGRPKGVAASAFTENAQTMKNESYAVQMRGCKLPVDLVIRNTFIEVEDRAPKSRVRSNSCPTAVRLASRR